MTQGINGNDDWRTISYGTTRQALETHLREGHPHIDLDRPDAQDLSVVAGWHDADHLHAGEEPHQVQDA